MNAETSKLIITLCQHFNKKEVLHIDEFTEILSRSDGEESEGLRVFFKQLDELHGIKKIDISDLPPKPKHKYCLAGKAIIGSMTSSAFES